MNRAYVAGRVPARYERLVTKQARAAKTSKSDLVARYVIEKSLCPGMPRNCYAPATSQGACQIW